jgi:hypothetical protein
MNRFDVAQPAADYRFCDESQVGDLELPGVVETGLSALCPRDVGC